jgi:hypothetical protein
MKIVLTMSLQSIVILSLALGLGLTLVAQPAYAQNDTATQVGSQHCSKNGSSPFDWQCPYIPFKPAFGAPPTVIVTLAGIDAPYNQETPGQLGIRVEVDNTKLTAQGFTPKLEEPYGTNTISQADIAWVAIGQRVFQGTSIPKYLILTVIYAPPGTEGHATSSVSYGSGSTTGTTTSVSQSFQNGIGISVTEKLPGLLGPQGEGSLSFDYTSKTTNTQSLDVKKSISSTIPFPAPAKNGINHDYDAIYLLLKPKIDLSLSLSAASWTFGDNSQSHIQYVYVGELNKHLTWRGGVQEELNAAGITESDYPIILASDPLAARPSALDPPRFVPAKMMFPYEPPATPNDSVIPITTTISTTTTSTAGSTTENSYKVGMSLTGSVPFLDLANTTMKDTANWVWTNASSVSTSSTTTQSASITIGGPSHGYTGATEVAVYMDTVYNTYAFVIVPPGSLEVAVKGSVVSAEGAPLAATEVILTANSGAHRTFTNAKGEYVFFGNITEPVAVQAAGVTRMLPQAQTARNIDIRKP